MTLSGTSVVACYRELAAAIGGDGADDGYFAQLARAMSQWADLFEPVLQPQPPRTAAMSPDRVLLQSQR